MTATGAGGGFTALIVCLLPALLLLFVAALWTRRRVRQTTTTALGAGGRSPAQGSTVTRPSTRFADVAGYAGTKQEISEIVDFLRDPARYAAAGAVGPRGVLMAGPPGTGKTLLARAVAGETQVPFLSITGSAFVELFAGVGAGRIRGLFRQARNNAPSIIFIDEVDAIGCRRAGSAALGGNDEREQTLNQLLAEMDGFDDRSGVVVLAATNRPGSLDPALLRPGRFDRQVSVPLPHLADRAAVLAVHARGKHLAPDADLAILARSTPGFSGADLANLLNEAAINAVRGRRTIITARDLGDARDRILLGQRDTSNALQDDERRWVAVHESGHAIVATLCEHADPVARVTILPSGMALGATEQLPDGERRLHSQSHLAASLAVRLGGRAAELVVFGEGSTGAADDLTTATRLATRMVREFGLSPALGPVGYAAAGGEPFDDGPFARRPYSEATQRAVDRETGRLLREAETRALHLLRTHRAALDDLSARLLDRETLTGDEVRDALRATPVDAHPERVAGDRT